ncbi:MAG: helical backbone metal receptor [Deltaproteobacteria bacterium]|nr:helical backbone metal receptor [Kofleriaceae bacterium]
MPSIKIRDDLGRDLVFVHPPRRVVSLVPSDTYTLFALGAGDRVVGRTTWCELPAEAAAVPTVGGTKDVDVDAVLALQPDLVVANQEENTRAALERLAERTRVLVSLPRRVADGVAHVARLARALGIGDSPVVKDLVRKGYELVRTLTPAGEGAPRAFVPIWMDPLMTFNADTFGADVLALAGVANAFGDRLRLYPLAADLGKAAPKDAAGRDERYPRITLDEVRGKQPDLVILPDEPHAFGDADRAALAGVAARMVDVSGKDLFWYGAWTIETLPRLREQLAPVVQLRPGT